MRSISSAAYVTSVLRFLQAYNAGDFHAVEELLTPDAEWNALTVHSGRADVLAYLEDYRARWTDPHVRPEDFKESDGRVMIVVVFSGASLHTQRMLEERQSWICELTEEGKIRRVTTYLTAADAADALDRIAAHV